ncbi:Unannotated [Lentimonas sp. CC19]|nr:Unannotated [Lentimonas sp. CC10]CAA6691041.1 Unannotated [Lentimonas sp. CC19]CAA7069345.1 Unannotated [Lentimonas sp. CC11]
MVRQPIWSTMQCDNGKQARDGESNYIEWLVKVHVRGDYLAPETYDATLH